MKYLRLFEFEDAPWLPSVFRDAIRNFSGLIMRLGRLYDPVIPMLNSALERASENRILDCCSGAGGPWLDLYPKLKRLRGNVQIKLCDYFPIQDSTRTFLTTYPHSMEYLSTSIDAKNIPKELMGFRTIFSSFHHFDPEQALKILQDAVAKQVGIGIFECSKRDVVAIMWMFIVPVIVWLMTPFIRPFSWKRLFWTYLVPVIPFLIAWDGLISCLRTYSCTELRELTQRIDVAYDWEIGTVKGTLSPVPITYLIGTPPKQTPHIL